METATHCPYCALQCAMTVTPGPDGPRIGARDFPTNRGGLCRKGWTSAELLGVPDRLTTPLVRRDGELTPATWAEAYAVITTAVREAWGRGRDRVGVFGGGGLTNEKAYTLGKFARLALRTSLIDYNGRFCMSSAAAAGTRSLGLDRGLPFPLTDLNDSDAVLLAGSNLADTMPPSARHLDAVRSRGGLIVIDPRRSATARLCKEGEAGPGGVHLQAVPGTDIVVLLGLLHLVVAQGGVDEDYVAERVTGWEAVRRSAAQWWPEQVERVAGVPVASLRRAAAILLRAAPHRGGRGAHVLTGRGAEQSTHGTDTVSAAINLALALGLPGRERSGYGCLTGQGNGQGGREHGQKCDQLPGYRSIADPAARAHVAAVWGVDESFLPGPGVPAMQLIDRLGRRGTERDAESVDVLLLAGANPVVSAPDAQRVTERLRALDLLVVSDFVLSETAALADVVLPVRQWAEETGTMTSLEGRVLRRRRAVTPPAGTRDELTIWSELAAQLGCPVPLERDPDRVLAELGRASAGGRADYSGVTAARLDAGEALYWPVPGPDHPGTPRLFGDRFATPDGRAVMVDVTPQPVADALRADAPLHLVTGRLLEHYQSGAQTRRIAGLAAATTMAAEIHPLTAARHGLADGDRAVLTTARGEITVPVRLSLDVRADTIFLPFHFGVDASGDQRANTLTNAAVDPVSAMPEFKVCAVAVRAAVPEDTFPTRSLPTVADGARSTTHEDHDARGQGSDMTDDRHAEQVRGERLRVVVVGHGMVGSRFGSDLAVAADSAGRPTDLLVLAAEPHPAYNRLLLSEVVAGRAEADAIALPVVSGNAHVRVDVRLATPAVRIDRAARVVETADGQRHGYDRLVLATGADPWLPPVTDLTDPTDPTVAEPTLRAGVLALRTREDADELIARARPGRRAVVVGGGLLGLEVACGLRSRGMDVGVVHLAPHLLERQLDPVSAGIAQRTLADLGITCEIGVSVSAVLGDGAVAGVRLSDDCTLECDTVVLTAGIAPRTRLAAEAGLATERGIVVDDQLATSDPSIFAIGDCAQPPEGAFGLLAPGWDQARRLASHLSGGAVLPTPRGTDAQVVKLKAVGLDMITLGGGVDVDDETAHVVEIVDRRGRRRTKVAVAEGRVVGAECVGAPELAAALTSAFELRTPVPNDPAHLLVAPVPGTGAAPVSVHDLDDDAPVCRCNGVTKGEIVAACAAGCRTPAAIAEATRATTGCGGCRADVCALLAATPATAAAAV